MNIANELYANVQEILLHTEAFKYQLLKTLQGNKTQAKAGRKSTILLKNLYKKFRFLSLRDVQKSADKQGKSLCSK